MSRLEGLDEEEASVVADALDAFQQAERYGAGLEEKGASRDRKYRRAKVADRLLAEVSK